MTLHAAGHCSHVSRCTTTSTPYFCRLESVRAAPCAHVSHGAALRTLTSRLLPIHLPNRQAYSGLEHTSPPGTRHRACDDLSRPRFAPGGDEHLQSPGACRIARCGGCLKQSARGRGAGTLLRVEDVSLDCRQPCAHCPASVCKRHGALLAPHPSRDKRLAVDAPRRIPKRARHCCSAASILALRRSLDRRPAPAHLDHMDYSRRYTCTVARLYGTIALRAVTWPVHAAVALSSPDGPHAVRQRG